MASQQHYHFFWHINDWKASGGKAEALQISLSHTVTSVLQSNLGGETLSNCFLTAALPKDLMLLPLQMIINVLAGARFYMGVNLALLWAWGSLSKSTTSMRLCTMQNLLPTPNAHARMPPSKDEPDFFLRQTY